MEKILSALDHVSSSMPRDDWYKILAAVKSELGDNGRCIAEDWSKNSDDYDPSSFNSTWNSLSPNGGINIGTLFHYAGESGWTYREPNILRDEAARLKRRQAETEKTEKKQTAAQVARSRWDAANDADPDHAYLMKKQIDPVGIRQEGNNLLIPVQDRDGNLISLQTITSDGKKLFQKGSTTGGGYMRLKGASDPVIICEGYATGVSLNQATGASVAVTFSCHNLMPVAKIIREKMPDMDIVIAADSKPVSTCEKAREVAKTINARLAVPTVDSDFNDMHMAGQDVRATIEAAVPPGGLLITDWGALGSKQFDPVDWVIEDLLPPGVSMLSGRPKQGKSWLVHAWAMLIAAGKPVFGMKTNRCKTLYLALEDSDRRLQARTLKLMRTHGIGNNDINGYFYSTTESSKLGDGLEEEIAHTIDRVPDMRLIIIDVLAKVRQHRKPQQSVYESDYEVGNALKAIAKKYPAVCFLIVHHNNKGSSDALDSISGTHGLAGGMDNTFSIMNAGQGLELHINGRDIENSDCIPLPRGLDGMFTLEDRESAFRKSMSISRGKIIDAIKEGAETQKDIAAETGLDGNLINAQLRRMLKTNVVEKAGRGKYQAVDATPTYPPHT